MLNLPENDVMFQAAKSIVVALSHAGFQVAIIGGAVRDLLLNRAPHDYDIVTTARPEQLSEIFDDTRLVGQSFGVSLVKRDGFCFEVATARLERGYMDGRHPDHVLYADDLVTDLQRRDFTVNAMGLNPETGEIIDVAGGQEDLKRGILRTVGDPETRFGEDYLRMLRAVRFAVRLNFSLEARTQAAIKKLAPLTAKLSGERIRQEIGNMLTGPRPEQAIKTLLDLGILAAVLPEVAALSGVEQPPEFHPEGDVFVHTMLMLEHMAMADANLAWSVLLHDIGKPVTFRRSESEGGRIRFFGHEAVGADMAEKLLNRLRFSVADRDVITAAVRDHMRFTEVKKMRAAKLRRTMASPNFPLEVELLRLDCVSCHGILDSFIFLLDKLRQGPEPMLPPPLVQGRDLINIGLKPSSVFGKVLERIYDRQLANEFATKEAALAAAIEIYNAQKLHNVK